MLRKATRNFFSLLFALGLSRLVAQSEGLFPPSTGRREQAADKEVFLGVGLLERRRSIQAPAQPKNRLKRTKTRKNLVNSGEQRLS